MLISCEILYGTDMKENVYYLKDMEDFGVAIKHLAKSNLYSWEDIESLQRKFWLASEFSGTRTEAYKRGCHRGNSLWRKGNDDRTGIFGG